MLIAGGVVWFLRGVYQRGVCNLDILFCGFVICKIHNTKCGSDGCIRWLGCLVRLGLCYQGILCKQWVVASGEMVRRGLPWFEFGETMLLNAFEFEETMLLNACEFGERNCFDFLWFRVYYATVASGIIVGTFIGVEKPVTK